MKHGSLRKHLTQQTFNFNLSTALSCAALLLATGCDGALSATARDSDEPEAGTEMPRPGGGGEPGGGEPDGPGSLSDDRSDPGPIADDLLLGGKPFAERKVVIPTDSGGVSSALDQGTRLVALVDDACRLARAVERVTDAESYFFEPLLPPAAPPEGVKTTAEAAYEIELPRQVPADQLEAMARQDPCIVGVSVPVRLETVATGEGSGTAADHLEAIGYAEGRSLLEGALANQRVRVAFIDTGLDLKSQAFTHLADGPERFNLMPSPTPGAGAGLPDDGPDYHGTAVVGIAAAQQLERLGIRGIASDQMEVIPLKVSDGDFVPNRELANAILAAVNFGAEVINLGFAGETAGCDPITGLAIYRAVQRGALVIMPAGKSAREISSPKDLKNFSYQPTVSPACWGLYFKGAITVAGLKTGSTQLAAFSDFGDAVELAAPATELAVLGGPGPVAEVRDGNSFAAPQITAAAVWAIAYHKARGWDYYDPWLIEDVLLNASPAAAPLHGVTATGRHLSLADLARYLRKMDDESQQQRAGQASSNPQDGVTWQGRETSTRKLDQLLLTTKDTVVRPAGRAQYQAIAVYDDNSFEYVTSAAQWKLSAGALQLSGPGLVLATAQASGSYEVSASFGGLSAKAVLIVSKAPGETLQTIVIELDRDFSRHGTAAKNPRKFKAFAIYSDGFRFDITQTATWTFNNLDDPDLGSAPAQGVSGGAVPQMVPGPYEVTVSYQGKTGKHRFDVVDDIVGAEVKIFFSPVLLGREFVMSVNLQRGDGTTIGTANSSSQLKITYGGKTFGYVPKYPTNHLPSPGDYPVTAKVTYALTGKVYTASATLEVREPQIAGMKLDLVGGHGAGFVDGVKLIVGGSRYQYIAQYVYEDERELPVERDRVDKLVWSLTAPDGSPTSHALLTATGGSALAHVDVPLFRAGAAKRFRVTVRDPERDVGTTVTIVHEAVKLPQASPAVPLPSLPGSARKPADPLCTTQARSRRPYAGGSGKTSDPYRICSAAQLAQIGAGDCPDCGASFRLLDNIDLADLPEQEPFRPLGRGEWTGNRILDDFAFRGRFDGNDYVVANLHLRKLDGTELGLFGYIRGGAVKKLRLVDAVVEGKKSIGALAGRVYMGTFEDVTVVGALVRGESAVGGLFGFADGIDARRLIASEVTVDGLARLGGIVGEVQNSALEAVSARGLVQALQTTAHAQSVGGIAGRLSSSHVHSCGFSGDLLLNGAKATVAGKPAHLANGGGIVGATRKALIENCSAEGTLIAAGENVGGLIGSTSPDNGEKGIGAAVLSSWSSMSVTSVYACDNPAACAGGTSDAGGLIGDMASGTLLANSYAVGTVAGVGNVGGLVGKLDGSASLLVNSYFRGGISSQLEAGGAIGQLGVADARMAAMVTPFHSLYWHLRSGAAARDIGRVGPGLAADSPAIRNATVAAQRPADWDFGGVWKPLGSQPFPELDWQ